jgi:hypothetical protein
VEKKFINRKLLKVIDSGAKMGKISIALRVMSLVSQTLLDKQVYHVNCQLNMPLVLLLGMFWHLSGLLLLSGLFAE